MSQYSLYHGWRNAKRWCGFYVVCKEDFVKRKKRNIEQISTYVTYPGCNDLTNVEQIVAEVEALYWY